MDLSNALAAAEGQTVQPGDFNSGTQRTSAASPMASPQPAAPQPAAQPAAGQPVPQPAPAQPIGPRSGVPQPQPAAPSAGQPRGPAPASPSPGQPAMGAAASPAPAGPWTLRSQLQQIGFDTSQMADDQAAWSALAGRLAQWNQSQQQNAQLAQYGQFYLANKARFDALQQQGQGQGQPGVAQPGMQPGVQPGAVQDKTKNLFGSPEFNPEWMKIVQFDPNTGKAVVPLGYDPSIGPKVDQYVAWRKDAFEKFLQDPISMLKDGLMPLIQQEAQKLAGQAVGGFSDQQFATQYVNSQPWMFQQDAQGNRVFDPVTGQPLLTPGGLRFRNYVEVATRQGIAGVREQAMWATAMVERDALIWQLQQAQAGQVQPGQAQPGQVQQGQAQPGTPGAVNAQQQAAALQMNGARRIAGSGANSTPQAPAAPAQPRRPLGRGALRSRLAGALQQAGIN